MKYLKLFEDHKETYDKLKEIEDKFSYDKNVYKYLKDHKELINQYKNIIGEFLYDISDYPISANVELKDITKNSNEFFTVDRKSLNFKKEITDRYLLLCEITFTCDKYKSVLDSIKEVMDRIKEAHNINPYLYCLDYIHTSGFPERIPRFIPRFTITDRDFNNYERFIFSLYNDSTKFKISILF
jgi:hypothetical protein